MRVPCGSVKYLCLTVLLAICLIHVILTFRYIYFAYFVSGEEIKDAVYLDRMQQMKADTEVDVPRIVHQMWKTSVIPKQWYNATKSWKIKNPEIRYMLWTDYLLERFISDSYPWLLNQYQSYAYNIQRADMVRYMLLFHFGGVYADLDIKCKMSLNSVFLKMDKKNFTVAVAPTDPYGFSNDLMFAKSRSNFMKYVILGLKSSNRWFYLPYLTVMLSTGSLYFSSVLKQYPKQEDIYVIPKKCYTSYCFSHLDGGSWHGVDGKIIWSLFSNSFNFYCVIISLCVMICVFFIFCCVKRCKICRNYRRLLHFRHKNWQKQEKSFQSL